MHGVDRWAPAALGVSTLIAFGAALEGLIRVGAINAYIVPLPSQVLLAFERVVVEENVLHRFLLTTGETLVAGTLITVVGVALGVLLHRVRLLRAACETWVAAFASAPIVLMYPLFLVIFGRSAMTIVMIGFIAGLPPVILKTVEGLAATRQTLLDVGRTFRLTNAQLFRKILMPAALPSV